MPTTTEVMRVEVEMRAREALQQFEKLDAQFRETAGNNKQLYQELWRQHKKYVADVARENKKREADEAWLTRELEKEKKQQAKDAEWLERELKKEDEKRRKAIRERSRDEAWLTRELEREQKQRARDAEKAAREAERAARGPSRGGGGGGFGGGFGGIGDKILAASVAVESARRLGELADIGLRASDSLAGVHRGLETVYGSSERAAERFKELNELAKFPGLDPEPLARFDAIFTNLGSTAKQNDILFTGLAKSITTFGGDVFSVSSALYQLSQAFAKNKIDAQDFKSISEQTGGTFLKTAAEVKEFTGGIEGMREAFKASGETLQNFLMPVFVQLNEEFEGAPVDSYTNQIDNLAVAFKNFTAEVFSNASFVGGFLSHITAFLEQEKEVWNQMRTGGAALKAVGTEASLSSASLSILQKDLWRVSAELETQTEKYQELKDKGIHPNTQSMQHLDRSIKNLEAAQARLSGKFDTAKSKMAEMLTPVENVNQSFKILTQEIESVDTRFLSFRERGDALKGAISELPPELTQVREGLSESTTWAENLEKQFDALRVSTQGVQGSISDLNIELKDGLDTYMQQVERAKAARQGLTDVSGSQRPVGDFTEAQRRLHQPADIENQKRSHVVSPLGNLRRTQSDAFLGIDRKVQEFEQVTDISIDKLDEFSAQTQHTTEELQKLNQEGLSNFSDSLFDVVNAVDTLTPVIEDVFGIDMTSQRSHGRLAVNTAEGIGQVIAGDIVSGLSTIARSMWEWGQPDPEGLRKQHEEALERERQRVAKIQAELDAYTAEREELYAARMDFLKHGQSTFEDWTDTLKSFSDHDLVRGREVFTAFSEAMNAYNDEVNQARLKLEPTAASVRYNMLQRLKDIPTFTPTPPSAENLAEYNALADAQGGVRYGVSQEDIDAAARQEKEQQKILAEIQESNARTLEISRTFVGGIQDIFTSFQEATDALKGTLPSMEFVLGRSQTEAIAADQAFLDRLRTRTPGEVTESDRLAEQLTNTVSRQLEGFFTNALGQGVGDLFSFGGVDPLEILGIKTSLEHFSPDRLVSEITARLPSAIESLQSGDISGVGGGAAEQLSEVLQSLTTEEQVLETGFENLNESILTLPEEMTPRLDAIETAVQDVVSAVETLANQPVSVSVNMNTDSQVVSLISDALAEKDVEGTRFRS